ncbi:MAG: pentapeptide repeat-containing protein [Ruminococcaceae bacterium]|nr:pentapeptide repeat-containing protein [Oscillospiraceae bacterium]
MRTFTKQELDQILDKHKLWLSSNGEEGERADLRCADLRYANLRCADLSYADLRHADLHSADLSYANLSSADLHYANLSSADLHYANLSYANLHYADLNYANLYYADLSYANLKYANLRYANLSCTSLNSADLSSADLNNADLDFSAFPLWCGGLNVHIDDKIATQLLYHLVYNVKLSPHTSKQLKSLCNMKSILKQANKFHRVDECGSIEQIEQINFTDTLLKK